MEHNKICAKKLSDLLKQYDIIKMEYEYEYKKNENREKNIENIQKIKLKKNNKNKNENKNESIDNINISKSTKNINVKTDCNENENKGKKDKNKFNKRNKAELSKNMFQSYFKQLTEKKKRKDSLLIKEYAFINDNIKLNPYLNSNSNKNINIINSIIVNMKLNNSTINKSIKDSNSNSNKTLFTKSEKNFLSKIIPDNCLYNYENKYNSIINDKLNIKVKMIDNIKQKKIINEYNLLKLENSSLQNNVIYRKKLYLNTKICEYNKKKRAIIQKIRLNQNYLKRYKLIYNTKNYEYNQLCAIFKEIYEDIRNRKLFLKKGEMLTQANIEAMDKWGMRGSNNTSFDDIQSVDYANVSEYENEEIEDENNNENENNIEENEEENEINN